MIDWIFCDLQRRAARQQSYEDLSSSVHIRRECHRLAVRGDRGKLLEAGEVGHAADAVNDGGVRGGHSRSGDIPEQRDDCEADQTRNGKRDCPPREATTWQRCLHRAARRQVLETEGEVSGVLESCTRLFHQAVANDALQGAIHRHARSQFRGIVVHDGAERLGRRAAPERREPGQHLEQDRAKAEDVGPVIDAKTTRLFGRHVRGCADDRGDLHAADGDGLGGVGRFRANQLRQSEVENLDSAFRGHEQIGRFDIAVHDAAFVRRRERAGDLDGIVDHQARRQRPPVHPLPQRLADEQLGDDPGEVALHADVVDREDVRVVQAARGARFLFEPALAIGIARECRRQDFDGHVAPELWVVCAIDLAHAADPETAEQFESADAISHGEGHGRRSL